MLPGVQSLPEGLRLRPATSADAAFLASLYRSTRWDLRLVDAEHERIESLIDFQQQAQTSGYGESHPDAFTFIVEKLGDRIGRVMVLFGEQEVRILDISLIPAVQGRGLGGAVLQALQRAAEQVKTPLTLCVWRLNPEARQFYVSLGFQRVSLDAVMEQLVWLPSLLRQGRPVNR
ncbi:hypothetical protein SIID45300_00572 [Candidatus Magnetaquicoccaceae bacterium FCR-1]|uniref:N-acetyltransferase domain-containing protein n=1 Tax=Candidatus Magnetaquiglobus chichijimensis TaxID=3141448 RepID=A0ABQ0C5X6_9PROT